MTAISQTVQRARRIARLYQHVHEQTGSLFSAAHYVAHTVSRRIPMVIRRSRSASRYSAEVERIVSIKAEMDLDRPFLGIKFSGGLGDSLVVARFIRDLSAHVGPFDFDIYATDPIRAQWVFSAVEGLRGCHDDVLFDLTRSSYDLSGWVNQFVVFNEIPPLPARPPLQPKLVQAARNAAKFRPKIEPFIQHHPYMDGYLAQKAVFSNRSRTDFLHSIVDVPYGGDLLGVPVATGMAERYGLTPGKYITVHNGFDPDFFTCMKQATKCYPHFGSVLSLLKQKRPDIRFVQIGVKTSQPLVEADLDVVNRTSLKEAAGLIGDAMLHIDNEGGLVHLARCLGVNSAVIFGPTPSNYFGYSGNVNIDPVFCGGCWWSNETWMDRCPRGFETARCMTEQSPQAVANAIERHLADNPAER